MRTLQFGIQRWLHGLALLLLVAGSAWAQEPSVDDKTLEVFREGQELIQSGDFAEASKRFQECVKADKDFGEGWFMLGYATHMDGRLEEALKYHRKATEFDGQFKPIAAYNIACAQALLGQPAEALDSLKRAVELGYDDVEQMNDDSDLYSLHTSTDYAQIVAQLRGKDAIAEKLSAAQDLINEQDFEKAAEIYQAIVEDDSDNDFARYRLGYALHGAGKLDEAIEHHQKATKFLATKGIANYNWGCALSLKGEKEAALEKLQAAVKAGFAPLNAFQDDPDLENLRDDESFKELVASLEEKSKMKSKPEKASADSEESAESADAEESAEEEESEENESSDDMEVELPPYALGVAMRVEDGVFVEQVLEGSAAEKSGIEVGDKLVKANGTELGDDPLAVLFPLLKSDKPISLELIRNDETKTVELKPTKR